MTDFVAQYPPYPARIPRPIATIGQWDPRATPQIFAGAPSAFLSIRNNSAASACTHLRNSEDAQEHTILLPFFHELTTQQQEAVVTELAAGLKMCAAV